MTQPPPPPGPGPEEQPPPPPSDPYPAYQPYGSTGGGYGAPNPYVGGAPYQVKPPTNGMAIGAMVTSLVGLLGCLCYGLGGVLGLVGAILGHVSMRQINRTGHQGRGFALTGIIAGWACFALAVIGWIVLGVFIASEWDTTCPSTDPDYPFC